MFFYIARFVVGIYYCLFYRIEVIGQEHIPKKGGFVLCANHQSVNDPMVLGVVIKRPLDFIGKKELFKNKFFSFILKWINVIPVDRSTTDMSTFKTVLSRLESGRGVGIFAQGTRMQNIDAQNAKAGAALFALKADVPIVPVCVSAGYKHFSKIYVNIGEAIYLDEYKGAKIKTPLLNEITERVMQKISALSIKES